jgi:hypothetical protein
MNRTPLNIRRRVEKTILESFKAHNLSKEYRCLEAALLTNYILSSKENIENKIVIGGALFIDFRVQYRFQPKDPEKPEYHAWILVTEHKEIVDLAIEDIHLRSDFPNSRSSKRITNTWSKSPDNGVKYLPVKQGSWDEISKYLYPLDIEVMEKLADTADKYY